MAKTLWVFLMLVVLAVVSISAQRFPPGYVDPLPLLAAASKEINEQNFRCVTFSGTGYGGAVGQTFEQAVNIDWPRVDALANYTRTINWETGTSKETSTASLASILPRGSTASAGRTARPSRSSCVRRLWSTGRSRGRLTATAPPWLLHLKTRSAGNWTSG